MEITREVREVEPTEDGMKQYELGGTVVINGRKMHDLPPMALVALVGSIIACATSFGLDVTAEQKAAIEDLMRNLVVIGAGDYLLRIARNAFNR